MSSEMANQITEYEHQIKLLNDKLLSIDKQLSSLESYNVLDEYHNLVSNNKKNNKFKELENEYSNIQKDYELYKLI